jgi:hypothetical protein
MSLLAIVYHLVPEAPILVAYNREESFDRIYPSPSIQSGKPRILASIDQHSGGTYLGVNQNGLFVGVVRRKKNSPGGSLKSRGALAREMLKCNSARQAVDLALEELQSNQFGGVNYVVADPDFGWVVQSGRETTVTELDQGLSIVAERGLNNPEDDRSGMAQRLLTLQTLDSPVKFLAIASKVLARTSPDPNRPSMVIRQPGYGTVSSTLISLGTKPRDAIYQYSNGSPDQSKFEDYSPLLRDILSRGLRENRAQVQA